MASIRLNSPKQQEAEILRWKASHAKREAAEFTVENATVEMVDGEMVVTWNNDAARLVFNDIIFPKYFELVRKSVNEDGAIERIKNHPAMKRAAVAAR